MKKIIKAFIKVIYKLFRGIYRVLPLPRSVKERIRMLVGKAAFKLQKSLQYEDADVKQRYAGYEETINEYRAYADLILQTGEKCEDFTEYKENKITFTDEDVKPIAFYLPQFHTIAENDRWWGKGFTEWTNVTKAVPRFLGHYQPQLPYDSTFYDLANIDVMRRQVELAKNYGVYGFCFHYYWFGGKRLLEKPLENFLNMKEGLELPFCICWANENWTRRWDGFEDDVLIAQEHSDADYLACIADICRYIKDERYIRANGKPLIIVYRVDILPDVERMLKIWRDYCHDAGIGDIHVVGTQAFGITDPTIYGFDGGVEYPPHSVGISDISHTVKQIGDDYIGKIYDMKEFIDNEQHINSGNSMQYRAIFPGWDNTPRSGNRGNIYRMTLNLYRTWLEDIMCYTKETFECSNRFVFINAWNEWGEGAHLEPCRKYGYAYLQATADIALRMGMQPLISVIAPAYNHERFIESSLRSVAAQTYPNIELIIIDDGSTDRTVEMIDKVTREEAFYNKFKAINVIKHGKNIGAANSINEGIKASSGRFVSIINTDDLYEENRLDDMHSAISGKRFGLAFSTCRTMDDDSKSIIYGDFELISKVYERMSCANSFEEAAKIFNTEVLGCNLAVSTGNMLFTRRLYDKLEGFNDYSYTHDWDFLLRATLVCQPVFVTSTRYHYRVHGENSFSKLGEQEGIRQGTDVLRDVCTRVKEGKFENELLDDAGYIERLEEIERG